MSRLVNDITAVRMLLGVGFLNLINTPIYYVYAVSIMASLDWRLTVAALVPYPIVLVVVKRTSRQLMERTLQRAGGPGGDERPRAGEPLRHARREVLRARAGGDGGVRSPERRLLGAEHGARAGARHDHAGHARRQHARDVGRPLVRRPARHLGRAQPRRPGRLHRLPAHPRLADHGARLDAVDRAARPRGDAASGADLRRSSRPSTIATRPGRRARRSAARSRSTTSSSPTRRR